MRKLYRFVTRWAARAAILLIVAAACARAGVTMHEQTTFDVTILKAHGTTNSTTSDKQWRDFDLHCEGLWALLRGNQESTEIVRLDGDLSWERHPKKETVLTQGPT